MRKLHLISNAHLDPVWQWEWEEGAAAAVSTFRAAAEFCREYDGYVFNHNEALLYRWIEEYEPGLFAEIQELVRLGKWHIMGGWYLQPDCNMPSGESIVRQIVLGRSYFREKFGARPTTAINFDSFGHSRGLVQIMKQAGYDSYLFMRPEGKLAAAAEDFVWVGFDGSEVLAHQISEGYNTLLGEAHKKIGRWLEKYADEEDERPRLLLWGVGNHGGGPSRLDLDRIGAMMAEEGPAELAHSTPEAYFAELKNVPGLPRHDNDLNPRFVGCYTSMIRIKQKHRKLENELYATEKMLASAAVQGLLRYPAGELKEAFHDLMVAQFHDILPGSSIQPAEEASIRLLDHGLEIASRLRARAFFALASGQPKANLGEYPILVYNPHPYPVRGTFACEFMLEDQNWTEEFSMPVVYRDGEKIAGQPEKEHSNLNLDWRKRVVFEAELAPSSMNRFDCRMVKLPSKPKPVLAETDGYLRFRSDELEVAINTRTGLIDDYIAGGVSRLKPEAFLPLVLADNEDPWRMDTDRFGPELGRFRLMSPGRSTAFSGVKEGALPAVRVIEDGEVRTVVEALLEYGDSALVLTYRLPKRGTELEVEARVYWNEKDKLLKLAIPTQLGPEADYSGQTVYGVQRLPADGTEAVAQKWTALASHEPDGGAVTLINDGIYGSDSRDGAIRPTLIRGAAYCAHPIESRPILPQDRFLPRIDQGERLFTFWLNAGATVERLAAVDREALVHNEQPYALSFFPHGGGKKPAAGIVLERGRLLLTAFKEAEAGGSYVVRLFEPTGEQGEDTVRLPALGIERKVELGGFEIKTFRLDPANAEWTEWTLTEDM
ncbi:glycoside hydrolase family 38 N-terminal domain-containing protein [Cohnella fermenti]|uniref:Alpha-mannosidase n=1 Tax=Cohnella fermenti TaxID=2565925 RepID=A0A4S4C836_9BACL|nr:alpha-mannosidase [Cohnella fermenti]THF84104.1 alpha-mannosidase [Cohnella fermenti]